MKAKIRKNPVNKYCLSSDPEDRVSEYRESMARDAGLRWIEGSIWQGTSAEFRAFIKSDRARIGNLGGERNL